MTKDIEFIRFFGFHRKLLYWKWKLYQIQRLFTTYCKKDFKLRLK